MTVYSVSSVAELDAALQKAASGDTIELASGDYSKLVINNKDFGDGITITSADASNPATIDAFKISGSNGITISNIDFTPAAGSGFSLLTYQSSDIHFDNITVTGPDGSAGYDIQPFIIRQSSDVTVSNSEFTHLKHGITLLNNTGVTIENNYFHDLRTDGVRGGGQEDLVVSNNYFTDFKPQDGDHPDGIQLWTNTQVGASSNVTITDNVVYAPEGQATQGIFLRDENGNMPYSDVTITGNVVIGGLGNGIAVSHVDGGSITGNTVLAYNGTKSWVRVQKSTDFDVSDNSAMRFLEADNAASVSFSNNTELDPIYDGGTEIIGSMSEYLDSILPSQVDRGDVTINGFIAPEADLIVDDLDNLDDATTISRPGGIVELIPDLVAELVDPVTVAGTSGRDRLYASEDSDSIVEGGAGNDILTGGGAFNSHLVGGTGDDTYYVNGTGVSVIEEADGGKDTVYTSVDYMLDDNIEVLRLAEAGLTVGGNDQDNRIIGSDGADTIYGLGGDDVIQGQDGDDIIYGGDGNDTLRGDGGEDILYGEAGDDIIYGGAGNDTIYGGAGDDRIEGGSGVDTLWGGEGRDMFIFRDGDLDGTSKSLMETIGDFDQSANEKISLSLMDADTTTAADDKFAFLGTGNFTGKAGELRYDVSNGNAIVTGDLDGDGNADFYLKLLGVTHLDQGDFYL